MEERVGGASHRALQRAKPHGNAIGQTKQRRFLEHLAATCNVSASAKAAGASVNPFYRLRQCDPAFAAAWKQAMALGYDRLEEALLAKALREVAPAEFDAEAVEVVLVDTPPDRANGHGTRQAAGFSGKVALVDVQLALALLNRRQAADRSGGARSRHRANAEEVGRAINAKLDSLARRLGEHR